MIPQEADQTHIEYGFPVVLIDNRYSDDIVTRFPIVDLILKRKVQDQIKICTKSK